MAFATVVVREKLFVYSGGVYAGGAEVLSSVLDGTISEEASDEDGTSDVESAALLEGSALGEGALEGAGVSLLDSDVLDGDGDSLLDCTEEELGRLPELLEGDSTTVVGSSVEVTIVGETVTVGLSTDVIVD